LKKKNKKKKMRRGRKFIRRFLLLAVLFLALYAGFYYYYERVFPIATVLDEYVHQDVEQNHGIYVPLSEIPETLQQAVICTEDRRFDTDPGIDPIGIARSLFVDVKTQEYAEGGSTITQQLIRNVLLTQQQTISRKVKEIILSVAAYQHVSKAQILEYYLNDVYFGSGAYGVQKAALTYFGKPLSELNQSQLTMVAGLPNAPSVINPFASLDGAKQRQRVVLDNLVQTGFITQEQADSWYSEPLNLWKR
jgi:monofunctional glycosyltransferase